jgi:subfamily B ATP-binding cassette protein HlyB/CyaB
LILDEATSAVDYETEMIIQNNLSEMAQGRTVIIVAHRLASIRNCHRIIAIEGGRIVEDGPHEVLLQRNGGLYQRLWKIQDRVGT